jgi:hypothetical protein
MSTVAPWYRHFWPWFIFGLPGIVVVAGLSTWWIAAHNADDLVADDYYKKGLAINRELSRQQLAQELGVEAQLRFDDHSVEVTLIDSSSPPALLLLLSHNVDAKRDLSLRLAQTSPGVYQSPLPQKLENRWHWRLEPLGTTEQLWRLDGEISIDANRASP